MNSLELFRLVRSGLQSAVSQRLRVSARIAASPRARRLTVLRWRSRCRAGCHLARLSVTWPFWRRNSAFRGCGSSTRRPCGRTLSSIWRSPRTDVADRSGHRGPDSERTIRDVDGLGDVLDCPFSDGRFRACFGTGETARRTMGLKASPCTPGCYVAAVRGLLAGETVTIDGQPARMLHADGLTAAVRSMPSSG